MQVPVIEKPEEWMSKIIKLEALFRSCEGSQQVADLLKKVKKFHSSIKLQAPENFKYPGRRKGSSRPKYLPKGFGRPMWRKTSVLAGTAGIKAMYRRKVTNMAQKSLSGLKVTTKQNKNIKKKSKKSLSTQEPLDPGMLSYTNMLFSRYPQKNGFKRPATALEDYQYDNRTSVGKRVKFQPGFPVSHEIVHDGKGGFNPTADGWCGFRVLAHLIDEDQEKFPRCARNKIDDNFDTYWNKFKEFNKHDRRNDMLSLHSDLDQLIDLTPK
ncbi:hypothetical protein PHYBLDRAFT_166983 [Phycomyces blakesleeanus NRRL 1555(-)]|uniref:Uncharacterized protein n=1 Tax=Phycomyces blakesleeanus (strain ATCC 8743b / DSM 1359 / FGSC 10004 / NBRC 33097 / NRRL 1555) TaxID=763407 RepID=A0A162U9V4_PHYB8|nr:hypothetical protein PHYBLDRAFT_166983 [Phycomyces blakesleeanus NRRL 1555(-)]OAD74632.1 hypothetical protein PHYBLDRAFT_166983 [Phycomyces blakesleeanus NRRL 1555(-)]|eukprot:XP_018292672.1 hypothetical protein PHYBLDRAFT_166983 [Phycomyces blakesleeanus NRRL 1555(-)]